MPCKLHVKNKHHKATVKPGDLVKLPVPNWAKDENGTQCRHAVVVKVHQHSSEVTVKYYNKKRGLPDELQETVIPKTSCLQIVHQAWAQCLNNAWVRKHSKYSK